MQSIVPFSSYTTQMAVFKKLQLLVACSYKECLTSPWIGVRQISVKSLLFNVLVVFLELKSTGQLRVCVGEHSVPEQNGKGAWTGHVT